MSKFTIEFDAVNPFAGGMLLALKVADIHVGLWSERTPGNFELSAWNAPEDLWGLGEDGNFVPLHQGHELLSVTAAQLHTVSGWALDAILCDGNRAEINELTGGYSVDLDGEPVLFFHYHGAGNYSCSLAEISDIRAEFSGSWGGFMPFTFADNEITGEYHLFDEGDVWTVAPLLVASASIYKNGSRFG